MSLFHGDVIRSSNKFPSALQLPLRQSRTGGTGGEAAAFISEAFSQALRDAHLPASLFLSTPSPLPGDPLFCGASLLCPRGITACGVTAGRKG